MHENNEKRIVIRKAERNVMNTEEAVNLNTINFSRAPRLQERKTEGVI